MASSVQIDEACTPNISTAERRKRLVAGLVSLAIGAVILVILMLTGVSPWWRLALYPVFASATVGYFQWRDKT